ncbi:hypothetical protein TUM17577_11250 [Enterobacter asburiae]|nr:hypothetical protein TUM17577_11250 [Enterobacter asburiae]
MLPIPGVINKRHDQTLMNGEGGMRQSRGDGLASFSMLKMRMKMQMRNIRIAINAVNRCVDPI